MSHPELLEAIKEQRQPAWPVDPHRIPQDCICMAGGVGEGAVQPKEPHALLLHCGSSRLPKRAGGEAAPGGCSLSANFLLPPCPPSFFLAAGSSRRTGRAREVVGVTPGPTGAPQNSRPPGFKLRWMARIATTSPSGSIGSPYRPSPAQPKEMIGESCS